MSIHQLIQKLDEIHEDTAEHRLVSSCEKITKEVDKVLKRFNKVKAISDESKIDAAILDFKVAGINKLSRRQIKLITWGMSKKFDFWGGESLYSQKILFGQYIQYLSEHSEKFLGFSFLRTLIFSYFSLDAEGLKQYQLQIKALGQLVSLFLGKIKNNELYNHYVEINFLKQFQDELFESLELKNLVLFWEQTSNANPDLTQITDKFLIPKSSWFFENLFVEKVDYICSLNDVDFYSEIKPIISELKHHPLQFDVVLIKVLKRYYESKYQNNCHDALKNSVLNEWGHPYITGKDHWNKLNPKIKTMVVSWIVQEELEAFFRVLQDTVDVDQRRLNYWLRFLNKISYSEMLLGKHAVESKITRFVNFRIKFSGRYKKLFESTSSENNAFLFKIGQYIIIEYSKTGNATYIYPESAFSLGQSFYDHSRLRSANGSRLLHLHNWEQEFDRKLAKLGIYPD